MQSTLVSLILPWKLDKHRLEALNSTTKTIQQQWQQYQCYVTQQIGTMVEHSTQRTKHYTLQGYKYRVSSSFLTPQSPEHNNLAYITQPDIKSNYNSLIQTFKTNVCTQD